MFSAEDMLRYHRPFPFLATHNMRDKSGEIVTREDRQRPPPVARVAIFFSLKFG